MNWMEFSGFTITQTILKDVNYKMLKARTHKKTEYLFLLIALENILLKCTIVL